MWSQIFTALYFAHFLLVLPIVGLIETPTQLPRSISESVLAKIGGGAGAAAGATASPEKR